MQSLTSSIFRSLPLQFPNKRILSIDIGGTLAKTAFYIPRSDPQMEDASFHEVLTKDTIPSNYLHILFNVDLNIVELSNGDKIYLKVFQSHKI
jgi:hypothetical protein